MNISRMLSLISTGVILLSTHNFIEFLRQSFWLLQIFYLRRCLVRLIDVCNFSGGNPRIISAVSSFMLNVAPTDDLISLYHSLFINSSVLLFSQICPAYCMTEMNIVWMILVCTLWLNPHWVLEYWHICAHFPMSL